MELPVHSDKSRTPQEAWAMGVAVQANLMTLVVADAKRRGNGSNKSVSPQEVRACFSAAQVEAALRRRLHSPLPAMPPLQRCQQQHRKPTAS